VIALLLTLQLGAAPAPVSDAPGSATAGAPPSSLTTSPARGGRATRRSGKQGTRPPPTHVEAENIEYRYKEHQTLMVGNPLVTLRREDATLVCRRLVAENDQGGDIQNAVCEGEVKLTRGERVVTCDRATYDGATGRVVCRGDPVLRDGESVIACDEVVYDLDQDKVSLKRPKGTLVQKPGQPLPVAKGRGP
jgi:lipopolysaccharide transport protein LptA